MECQRDTKGLQYFDWKVNGTTKGNDQSLDFNGNKFLDILLEITEKFEGGTSSLNSGNVNATGGHYITWAQLKNPSNFACYTETEDTG